MNETPSSRSAPLAERELEHKRSKACDLMRWAGEIEAALFHISAIISRAYHDPKVSPRDKDMHRMQLEFCIRVLQKERNNYAEEAAKLWSEASVQSSPATFST